MTALEVPYLHVEGSHAVGASVRTALAIRDAGIDPLVERENKREGERLAVAQRLEFDEATETFISDHETTWRNVKHAQQWRNSLAAHVSPKFSDGVAQRPGFYVHLATIDGQSARALRLLILTAARSSEVRGIVWDEVDIEAAVQTVPPERIKAGRCDGTRWKRCRTGSVPRSGTGPGKRRGTRAMQVS